MAPNPTNSFDFSKDYIAHAGSAGPKDLHPHQSGPGPGVDFSLFFNPWTPAGLVLVYIRGARILVHRVCTLCLRTPGDDDDGLQARVPKPDRCSEAALPSNRCALSQHTVRICVCGPGSSSISDTLCQSVPTDPSRSRSRQQKRPQLQQKQKRPQLQQNHEVHYRL